LGRIEFIIEMKNLYQMNDDSIEVILNLIDQIHLLRKELSNLKSGLAQFILKITESIR